MEESVYELTLKLRKKYREKAIIFAEKNEYLHTDDINEIKTNTQFYEVNTNSGFVSKPKLIYEENTNNGFVPEPKQIHYSKNRKNLIESTAPYFIITNDPIRNGYIDDFIDDLMETRGGKRTRIRKSRQKRTRIRKSRQKRRTTKRRRR
jgi:hypothetical protein